VSKAEMVRLSRKEVVDSCEKPVPTREVREMWIALMVPDTVWVRSWEHWKESAYWVLWLWYRVVKEEILEMLARVMG
jgi:hypothetical protein